MDVFDSNIWIYALTRTCEPAIELVDQAVHTPVHVGVSAYIFDEVMLNLQRSAQPTDVVNRAQTRFADLVYGKHTIHGPTQAEIEQMDVERQRRDPRVQAMGEAFGIQEKDVPIVVYAHQCARTGDSVPTTIYTADREFAGFDPQAHFEKLRLEYVDCTGPQE